jgi:hypothetical protein
METVVSKNLRQHVFRWGVGNKFRAVNANRFTPVHFSRPKEVSIGADYFKSPDEEFIRFDNLNEQWEVVWHEHQKLNGKPFPVKKFGVDRAKQEAVEFLKTLHASGRLNLHATMKSDMPGVFWDARMQTWVSPVAKKAFSANKHGAKRAKQLAEECASSSVEIKLRNQLLDLLKRKNS